MPAAPKFRVGEAYLCEAFMSVFPYSYRMIKSFNVTRDESRISMYAGMLVSAFAFTECLTGMLWGHISDRIGRRPVLIFGLIGTSISMLCLGFSTNVAAATISRALGGLLNGNVGVLQTTVAELVKRKDHQPKAYSIMPCVWCLGSIIGPAIGGALAMPCESYPLFFQEGGLFDRFPFLLPNLVCVAILLLGVVNGILFIDETHPVLKHRKDRGRKLGEYLMAKLSGIISKSTFPENAEQCSNLKLPLASGHTESSPLLSSSALPAVTTNRGSATKKRACGIPTFSYQVVYIIIGYGILAFHLVSFDALMPIILSEAPPNVRPSMPFRFVGGLGMSTKSIGCVLAVQGIYAMIAQLWLFPILVKKLGALRAFRMVMLVWPLLYFAVPYVILLPHRLQATGVYTAMVFKITFHVIAFPSNAILLSNTAPSEAVLGTINGVAASTACCCRALGPTISGFIHGTGLKLGYNGFAWWTAGLVCAIGALEAYYIEDTGASHVRPHRRR